MIQNTAENKLEIVIEFQNGRSQIRQKINFKLFQSARKITCIIYRVEFRFSKYQTNNTKIHINNFLDGLQIGSQILKIHININEDEEKVNKPKNRQESKLF